MDKRDNKNLWESSQLLLERHKMRSKMNPMAKLRKRGKFLKTLLGKGNPSMRSYNPFAKEVMERLTLEVQQNKNF